MRPIDADAFKKYISEGYCDTVGMFKTDEYRMFAKQITESILSDIDEQPTIQPEKAQLSQEGTTSDLISRQAVINAIENTNAKMSMPEWDEITNAVMSLPTVQPKPQEWYWIKHETPDGGEQYECSRCGVLWEFTDGTPEDNEAYFCPKCGARMKGEQNG